MLMTDAAAAALLAALVLVIALGTVVPQHVFRAAGLDDLYHSWFLMLPAALLCVNLFHRAGGSALSIAALTTALGIGLVVTGAFYGRIAGWEGMLPLSVGEAGEIVYAERGARHLPFSVRLDAFAVEQNGAEIANFTSRLRLQVGGTVIGGGSTAVNRPFRFAGYSFYQEAYDPRRPEWSGLKVVKDPGVKFVFPGLALLNIGIVWCIVRHVRGKTGGDA